MLTYSQNIWQIGYIVQSLLGCRNRHEGDIDWQDYPDHEYVPEYEPCYDSERNYSSELRNILTAMLQCQVDARPTAQDVLYTIEARMPHFTQGMER